MACKKNVKMWCFVDFLRGYCWSSYLPMTECWQTKMTKSHFQPILEVSAFFTLVMPDARCGGFFILFFFLVSGEPFPLREDCFVRAAPPIGTARVSSVTSTSSQHLASVDGSRRRALCPSTVRTSNIQEQQVHETVAAICTPGLHKGQHQGKRAACEASEHILYRLPCGKSQ